MRVMTHLIVRTWPSITGDLERSGLPARAGAGFRSLNEAHRAERTVSAIVGVVVSDPTIIRQLRPREEVYDTGDRLAESHTLAVGRGGAVDDAELVNLGVAIPSAVRKLSVASCSRVTPDIDVRCWHAWTGRIDGSGTGACWRRTRRCFGDCNGWTCTVRWEPGCIGSRRVGEPSRAAGGNSHSSRWDGRAGRRRA